jgi:hypothetical protein
MIPWKSTIDSVKRAKLARSDRPDTRMTHDGRLLVLNDRGFWITAPTVDASVPSWQADR